MKTLAAFFAFVGLCAAQGVSRPPTITVWTTSPNGAACNPYQLALYPAGPGLYYCPSNVYTLLSGGGGGGTVTNSGTLTSGALIAGNGTTVIKASSATVDSLGNITSPSAFKITGSSSGTVSQTVNPAAGTWTFTWPNSAGSNGYVLQTDGSGNGSWVPQGNVSTSASNTYSNGYIQIFTANFAAPAHASINIGSGITTDPSAASNGELWINNTATPTLKYQSGGSTYSAATTAQLPSTLASANHKYFTSYTASTETFTSAQPVSADLSDLGSASGAAQLDGSGHVPITEGGTGAGTAAAALISLLPAGTRVGDMLYCSAYSGSACTAWSLVAGNNSGTAWLQQTAGGIPTWTVPGGGGNVSTSGSPAQYLTAVWADGTHILGIATGTSGQALVSGGASANPAYGTLPIAGGGTNATTAAAGQMPNSTSGTASSWTYTPTLGDATHQGTITLDDGGQVVIGGSSSGTFTLGATAATTSNTMLGPASVPATGSILTCVTSSTTCTITALADVAVGQVLASGGVGTAAAYTATPTITSATLTATTNQLVLGTTNTTTLNFAAPASSVTVTGPIVASGLAYVAGAAPSAGVGHFAGSTYALTSSAVVDGDLSGQVGISHGGTNASTAAAGQIPNSTSGSAASWTYTPSFGDATHQGTLSLYDGGQLTLYGSSSGNSSLGVSSTGVMALPSGTTATNAALTSPNFVTTATASSGAALGTTTNPINNIVMNISGTYGTGSYTFAGTPTSNLTITLPNGAVSLTAGTEAILGANTFTGVQTFTPTARSSGVASYMTINTPADTGITASTESIGVNHVTATRTWGSGTTAVQRENLFAGPTYAGTSGTATFTDAATVAITPPIVGSNAAITRGHSLAIVDSTSAASSITGGLVVAAALGTTATSVGIGGGNINAGGTLTVGGHVTVEGVTSTGATGTGKFVFDTSPTFTTGMTSPVANLTSTTNQLVLGTTNTTTLNFAAPASSVTVTGPIVASGLVYVAGAAPSAGLAHFAGSTYAVTSSAVALTDIATQAADTVLMNATGGSAAPTAVAMPTGGTNGCAGASNALLYNTSTHAWGCNVISGTGTVTVVSSGNLTSTAIVTGGGSQTLQTAAPTATMDSSGNISTPGSVTAASFTTSSNTFSASGGEQSLATACPGSQTYDKVFFSSTNHIMQFCAGSGTTVAATMAVPLASATSHKWVAYIDSTGTLQLTQPAFSDISGAAAGQILAGATPAFTGTPTLGVAASASGTVTFANATGSGTWTIGSSPSTTTNTLLGPTSVPTTGHLLDCTTSSTTCTLTDSGVVAANVLAVSSPTAHGVLLGEASQTPGVTAAGTANQVLQSGGAGADPAWSAYTLPATVAQGALLSASNTTTVAATITPTLGNPANTTGTITFANATGSGTWTIGASPSTTSNTLLGPTVVPTTGHLLDCTTSSTTCTLHDSGVATSQVVTSASAPTQYGLLVGQGSQAITALSVPAAGTLLTGVAAGNPAFSATPTIGVATTTSGTVTFANATGSGTWTIGSSPTTTTNTMLGPTSVPTSGDLLKCVTSSTTCTLTDTNILASQVVTSGSSLTQYGVVVGSGSQGEQTLAVPASGTVLTGVAANNPSFSATPTLGVATTTSGTVTLANATGAGTWTIGSSPSTTTNTMLGPSAVPATGAILTCATSATTCTITALADVAVGSLLASGGVGVAAAYTATPSLGTDNSIAGTLQLASTAASAHTIFGSAATTTNTILGFATAPTTGDLIYCATSSSICTLTDASILYTNVVTAASNYTSAAMVIAAGANKTTSSWGDFTVSSHTGSLGASGILDLHAASATAGFLPPSAAGASPITAGVVSFDSTSNTLAMGNGSTTNHATYVTGSTPSAGFVKMAGSTYAVTTGSIGAADLPATLSSGTAITNAALTTPKSSTINDANGNPFIASSATTSAVDSITVTNAAAGNPATVTIGATGSDSNINLVLSAKGSGTVQATSMALTTPSIGAATGTSLLASGIVDGAAPVTTTTTCTSGAHCALGATYKSGYTLNQHATSTTATFYDLPSVANTVVGMQYCVANDAVGGTGAAETGVITITPAATVQISQKGTVGTAAHTVTSGGVAGDSACLVAITTTLWRLFPQSGTWTLTP